MYENENSFGNSSVNSGSTGNNAANRSGEYFDYTACPTEELERRASVSKEEQKKRKRAERQAAKQARRARRARKKHGMPRKILASVSLGLCFGLFAGAGFYAVQYATGQLTAGQTQENDADMEVVNELPKLPAVEAENQTQTPAGTQVVYVQNDSISEVVADVMPAMVSIVNTYTATTTDFWGQSYQREGTASGSGIIVAKNAEELLIVSNNHVVEGANHLEVTFTDGTTAAASIKGLDSDMDLAVIAVALKNMSDETRAAITIAKLGDSDNLRLGEPVIAIGNALGYGQSVTDGIVSALNREITMEDGSKGTFIQTNAAINQGNSGGALLNINGEVIGINSSKISGSSVEGMGYAIPISAASPIISDLMERQTREKVSEDEMGYMGITLQDITEQVMQMYNMPSGVFVYSVEEGCAAEAAGIQVGDIIVKLDGQRVTSSTELKSALRYYRAGETTTVTVKRFNNSAYESLDLEITLGAKP